MTNKLVDIKTGQPVKPSGDSPGGQRAALIQDGKRWEKLRQKMDDGEIRISVIAAGQDLDLDDTVIPWLDSLIADDDKAMRHRQYLRAKSKKKD